MELAAAERTAAVAEGGFAFAFAEGQLVRALREGWWLLLDEINLAPPEVLERVAGLLEGAGGSVLLVERGDTVAVGVRSRVMSQSLKPHTLNLLGYH